MKKLLAMLLALCIILGMSGCFFVEKDDEEFDLEECLEDVEELLEEGQLEKAESRLKKALRKTDDEDEVEVLENYLERVQSMITGGDQGGSETLGTVATEATAQSTGATEPESATRKEILSSFDRDDMYKINVFLSNFAEQNFAEYPCSDYNLLMFGYMFAKVNNREVLGNTDTHYFVNKADMDSILTRFFGTTVDMYEGQVLDEMNYPVTYNEGAFFYPGADGASVSYCAVVTSMFDNGDGTYDVNFDVYSHVNPYESMAPYYDMTADQAKSSADLVYAYTGMAVVRDYVRSGNVETYQLIYYKHF